MSRIVWVKTFSMSVLSRNGQEKTSVRTGESHIEEGKTFWRTVVNRIGLVTVVWKIEGNDSPEGEFSLLIASAPASPVRTEGPLADAVGRTENCNGKWTKIPLQLLVENVHPYKKNLLGSLRKRWRPLGRGFLG